MEEGSGLTPVLLVVGLAFLVPMVLTRFPQLRIPVVVGEILAGMVIGRSGLDLVPENATLEVLAALGFAFLMFLSGLEIDFSMLSALNRSGQRGRIHPMVTGLIILALTIGIALSVAVVMSRLGLVGSPWLLALILSTTSLGIVLPVLREHSLSSTMYGQTILLAALIADFVTMVLITVVVAILSGGITLEVLLVGVLVLVFLLAARFAQRISRWQPLRHTLDDLAHTAVQIKVRGALAVMFAFVVLSEMLGAEVILGAFLAGALLALIASSDDSGDIEARHKLDAIGFGFIIPIFFIMVGVRFDLPALLSSASALVLFPVLLLAAYAVKMLPAMILRQSFSGRQALAAGVLLSSRLSLIVAASAIGLRLGLISEALNADIVLIAIVTSTLSPALFNRLLPAGTREEVVHPLLIVGAGRTGLLVAQRLARMHEPLRMIDREPSRVESASQLGFEVVLADAATAEGLLHAGIEQARGLAVTTGDDEYNLQVCRLARSTFGKETIIAYVQDARRLRHFQEAGAHVVNPAMASASVIDGLLRFPDAYYLLTSLEDDKDVAEIEMRNPHLAGRKLRDLPMPGDVLVLAVRRQGELFVPHGQSQLEYGDHVTLLGTSESVAEASSWLQRSNGAGAEVASSHHEYLSGH